MLALRMRDGIDPDEFARRYGVDIRRWAALAAPAATAALAAPAAPESLVAKHVELGTLAWQGGRLRLTDRGLPVADSVLADFVTVGDNPQTEECR